MRIGSDDAKSIQEHPHLNCRKADSPAAGEFRRVDVNLRQELLH